MRKKRIRRDLGQTKQGWYQGVFQPTNAEKYKGKKLPFYRSNLELKFMKYLDLSPKCLEWLSEEPKIPYLNPLTKTSQNPSGKMWNYHPDFVVKITNGVKTWVQMIEIKPYKQTKPPKPYGQGRSKRLVESETKAWLMNQAKWEAAKKYCENMNWEFVILTEKDIK
jgi:hypothetical protein